MSEPRSDSRARWPDWSIALLALASSITSIANGFAVDDRAVIEQNANVHAIANWWRLFAEGYWPTSAQAGLYRPITTLAFTIQWALGGGSPFLFHLVSIVLYVACAWLVYRLAQRLAGPTAGWIAAAVFAVHPVHVEAVGNVVGQAELISTLAVVAAALLYTKHLQRSLETPTPFSVRAIIEIVALYLVGSLAKENAIILPALLALIHIHVRRTADVPRAARKNNSWRADLAAVRPTYLVMIAVALAILWIRGAVLVDSVPAPNTALEGLDFTQRLATFCIIVVEWLRLFIWPVRLIPVYSPPYIQVAHGFDASAVPGFLIVLISIIVTIVASRRRSTHAIALGFEWLAISLFPVSNILFATGIIVAERTLFLPSIGFALIVGTAVALVLERADGKTWRAPLQFCGLGLLAVGLVRSAVHQRVWSDDGHVITAAIIAAPDSYVLDAMYADYALRGGKPAIAEQWLKQAIKLYPRDPSPHISLGQLYVQAGRFNDALLAFSVAMGLDRENS
ncbi:MAG TPA: hypothetical protein VGM50_19200, partial [Gemmatimonadaceae bacterium]